MISLQSAANALFDLIASTSEWLDWTGLSTTEAARARCYYPRQLDAFESLPAVTAYAGTASVIRRDGGATSSGFQPRGVLVVEIWDDGEDGQTTAEALAAFEERLASLMAELVPLLGPSTLQVQRIDVGDGEAVATSAGETGYRVTVDEDNPDGLRIAEMCSVWRFTLGAPL